MAKHTKEADEMDHKIMREMVRNSNRSYRRLARDIGLSPAATIDRIRSLEEQGMIIGYGARFDYLKLGFEFMAIVEISISGKDILSIEGKIAKLPAVAAVWDITGDHDAIAILMFKTRNELSGAVKRILAIDGVDKTKTNIVLNVVKRLTEFDRV